jgi:pimeloyl-ACP methyl ester carboxylesterase
LISSLTLIWRVLSFFQYTCATIPSILKHYGYSYEVHEVETADDYILTVFRLNGAVGDKAKPIIVMQHGIGASANSFLENGRSSPSLYFADRGYEVWLPSGRGTRYSKKHKQHLYNSKDYWNFTFEDLGTKDTKAYLDHIYNITKQKVDYLGFSQGFLQILAAFSLEPEYFRTKLNRIVGWGAVTRIDLATHVGIVLAGLLKVWPILSYIPITHVGSFDMDSCLSTASFCSTHRTLCELKKIIGDDFFPYNTNPHTGAEGDSTCMKTIQQLGYNAYERGFFRHPSYGERVEYELKNITEVPIAVCVGEQDLLAGPSNAHWLQHKFKSNGNFKLLGVYDYLGHRTFVTSYTKFEHYTDTYNFLQGQL